MLSRSAKEVALLYAATNRNLQHETCYVHIAENSGF
jgi:hypothetical protein